MSTMSRRHVFAITRRAVAFGSAFGQLGITSRFAQTRTLSEKLDEFSSFRGRTSVNGTSLRRH